MTIGRGFAGHHELLPSLVLLADHGCALIPLHYRYRGARWQSAVLLHVPGCLVCGRVLRLDVEAAMNWFKRQTELYSDPLDLLLKTVIETILIPVRLYYRLTGGRRK